MVRASRTFRVFVSSTFADLKEERNALQERVFPRLRDFCLKNGTRFQAIDLRWGVSAEAGLDQQTIRICMDEVKRCQDTSPRPNFIVLLGDRYGWQPPPPRIPMGEFDEIKARVSDPDAKARLEWYSLDENAVPPEYYLKPREDEYRDGEVWGTVERALCATLEDAVRGMPLEPSDRRKYETSATHQEIQRGALQSLEDHVFCYFRRIDFGASRRLVDRGLLKDYVNLDEKDAEDDRARRRLESLKDELRRLPAENVHDYDATWTGDKPVPITTGHLDRLCDDVYQDLLHIIKQEIERLAPSERLEREIVAHRRFGEERARFFTGRKDVLECIGEYVQAPDRRPLLVHGASGCGKSAVMAAAARQAEQALGEQATVVVRFIGTTPDSSNGRSLLSSLCRQIATAYKSGESEFSEDYHDLVGEFTKRLAQAQDTSDRRLVVFLDAVDQLTESDPGRSLAWLPAELPENVRVVVSVLDGPLMESLARRLSNGNAVSLPQMSVGEGEELLDKWLMAAGRTLQEGQLRQLLEKFVAVHRPREERALPLWLKLAFEEARHWVSRPARQADLHEGVDAIITRNLFSRLADEKNHGKTLVSHALGYLAASRFGLSEDEILEVLSRDKEVLDDFRERTEKVRGEVELPEGRLPVVIWSRLFFDLEPYLSERRGEHGTLMAFYHRQLREAVEARYLAGGDGCDRHRALADYFQSKADPSADKSWDASSRGLRELPYHLAHSGSDVSLAAVLTDLRYLDERCRTGDVHGLIGDYGLLSSRQEEAPYCDFLRAHAADLARHPSAFFSVLQHEGFPAAREAAGRLVDAGRWPKPWLRTSPLWMPALSESGTAVERVAVESRHDLGGTAACDFAADRWLAFFVRTRGEIGMVDLETGAELPQVVLVRRDSPLMLECSAEARHLVIAYENGEADVLKLSYDRESGELLGQSDWATVRYRVPMSETPVVVLAGGRLWWQDPSEGVLCASLDEEGPLSYAVLLPNGPVEAELSGIAVSDEGPVVAMRTGRDACIMIIRSGAASQVQRTGADVSAMCARGRRLAVALSTSRVEVLDLEDGLAPMAETHTELPAAALTWVGDELVWITVGGNVEHWDPGGDGPPRAVVAEKLSLVAPRRLASRPDGRLAAVSRKDALVMSIRGGGVARNQRLVAVHRRQEPGEYWGLQLGHDGIWAIDSASHEALFLANDTDPDYSFAVDGRDRLLGASRRGVGITFDFRRRVGRQLDDFPTAITGVAGHASGGFWLTDQGGTIYTVGADDCCRVLTSTSVRISGLPQIRSWPGLTTWLAMRTLADSLEADTVPVFVFIRDDGAGWRIVGERHFRVPDGRLNALTYDALTDRVWSFWTSGSRFAEAVRVGTPEEYVEQADEERPVELAGGVRAAVFGGEGAELYLLSKTGNVLVLDTDSLEVEAVLAPSAPITAMVEGPARDAVLLIEDEARVLSCRKEGGLR